jgi:hypothetical protein
MRSITAGSSIAAMIFNLPPLVADRVCGHGAQRRFALQSHLGGNARTIAPWQRDPAGDATGESRSTAGTQGKRVISANGAVPLD